MLVSVVIPTYNRAGIIEETLDSVLTQTYEPIEVVVVDDGSTDKTHAVIARFGEPVQYLRRPNGGQAAARNTGIKAARGDLIAFVDSDDLWLPRKLEKQVACLVASGDAGMVYGDAGLFDGENGQSLGQYSQIMRPYEGEVAAQLVLGNFIASPTPLVRRHVFEDVGYFNESSELRHREDWDMWLRIAAQYPIAYVPSVLARYRVHKGSVTWAEDPRLYHRGATAVIDHVVSIAPQVFCPMRSAAIAMQAIRTGRMYTSRGQIKEARAMFAEAIRISPGTWEAYPFWLLCHAKPAVIKTAIEVTRRWKRLRSTTRPR